MKQWLYIGEPGNLGEAILDFNFWSVCDVKECHSDNYKERKIDAISV